MYSNRRTVTTKSSNIPIRVHSRTNSHSSGEALDGGERTAFSMVEVDNTSARDSGCGENEESNESGSYTEGKRNSCEEFSTVSSQRFTTTELRLELEEDVGDNDDILKEELIHIFERERSTLELYFKNKMDDLLHRFRNKQMEWEDASRAEKLNMENSFAQEKAAMQKSFGEEIAKLTHTFNEERGQLEQYYKEQLKELREQLGKEQTNMEEKFAREKNDLKEKLEVEYQVMLRSEITEGKKDAMLEKAELEAQFSKEKVELERRYRLELTEEEAKLQRLMTEMNAKFAQERMELEEEFRQKIMEAEMKLSQEREMRCEIERQLEHEKMKCTSADSSRKQEFERLTKEIEELRYELNEKNKSILEMKTREEGILMGGRDGLSGRLRDDFERLLAEHKMDLDRNYQKDREVLEQTVERRLQEERNKMQFEMEQERRQNREVHLRGNGDMQRDVERRFAEETSTSAERGTTKGREERRERFGNQYENEGGVGIVEYQSFEYGVSNEVQSVDVHLLQNHNPSAIGSGEQSQTSEFYYVSPKSENALRIEINGLRRENEGLKAKATALEENIELHKKYKAEVKAEMERLQKLESEYSKDNDELFKLQTEAKIRDAQVKNRDFERKVKELRGKVKEEEYRATKAEKTTRDVQARVKELERQTLVLDKRAREADTRAIHAEEQLKKSKRHVQTASGDATTSDKHCVEEEWCTVEGQPVYDRVS